VPIASQTKYKKKIYDLFHDLLVHSSARIGAISKLPIECNLMKLLISGDVSIAGPVTVNAGATGVVHYGKGLQIALFCNFVASQCFLTVGVAIIHQVLFCFLILFSLYTI
jgi:hypothetical protein